MITRFYSHKNVSVWIIFLESLHKTQLYLLTFFDVEVIGLSRTEDSKKFVDGKTSSSTKLELKNILWYFMLKV